MPLFLLITFFVAYCGIQLCCVFRVRRGCSQATTFQTGLAICLLLTAAGCSNSPPPGIQAAPAPGSGQGVQATSDTTHLVPDASLGEFEEDYDTAQQDVADPVRGYNRAMFHLNNGVYYYFLKPVGKGWDWVMWDPVEQGLDNILTNVRFPLRFFASLAQGKVRKSGTEFGRFITNTTIGIAGIFDPANAWFGMKPPPAEDFDQTLAVWGVGAGGYFVFPFFGPSSFRGIGGFILDTPFDPVGFAPGGTAVYEINAQALRPRTDYENLMKTAIDPYTALRSAYFQNFEKRVAE